MRRSSRSTLIVSFAALLGLLGAFLVVQVMTRNDSKPSAHVGAAASPIDGTNPFRTGRTLVIPHGGGDGLFPENTLLAFERTMAMGADVVDVDLRISGDGVVIAFHDATVDRVTGTTGTVRDMTFEQLHRLDAGWAFTTAGGDPQSSSSHIFRGQGIAIPTFESILDEFPTSLLSVDLKDESMDMVQPVCDLLRSHDRSNDVFVGSNSDAQILRFRGLCPDVRTSAVMNDVYASRDAQDRNDPNFVPAVTVDQPPFRNGGRQLVDETSLAWRRRDLHVVPESAARAARTLHIRVLVARNVYETTTLVGIAGSTDGRGWWDGTHPVARRRSGADHGSAVLLLG